MFKTKVIVGLQFSNFGAVVLVAIPDLIQQNTQEILYLCIAATTPGPLCYSSGKYPFNWMDSGLYTGARWWTEVHGKNDPAKLSSPPLLSRSR